MYLLSSKSKRQANKPNYTVSKFSSLLILNNWYNRNDKQQDTYAVRINSNRRKCIECNRPSSYTEYHYTLLIGFRVCFAHLRESARHLINLYYIDLYHDETEALVDKYIK